MRITNLIKPLPVLITGLLIASIAWGYPACGISDYTDASGVNRKLNQLQAGNSSISRIHELAVTPGGTGMLMLEIGTEVGSGDKTKPAILVVGNMSGNRPVTTEAAMNLAERVIADPDKYSGYTWYIIPLGNPDASTTFFAPVKFSSVRNFSPFNDDMDELTDEDGYDDLDGDGFITGIRVKAPDGEWITLDSDPRLLRKADAAKGEKGIYKIYDEGIDNDGDGRYNEDGRGGTDVNLNFPHLFKHFTPTGGLFAGSSPEAFSIIEFAFKHPELAMVFAFGETNFLLTPPKGGRQGSVDMEKISIPEEIGKAMGFDADRTYSMKEIIEKVQPMVPPGMQIDEGMIASFLGLGAVVNPMKEDLDFYNRISEEYRKYLEEKGVKEERFDPGSARDGSFELWAYYHLGLPVFSLDIWGLPKVKEDKKEASGISAESIGKMSADDFLALGKDKIDLFLKETGAPAQYSSDMIIGAVKTGQLTPVQISGMLKQMPAPRGEEGKGDPREVAMLAFWSQYRADSGFVNWKEYDHPDLGIVEIGGFIPFLENTPPAAIVDSLLNLQVPYLFELIKMLPALKISDTEVTAMGGGVYQVEAWIENENYLPFSTAMGLRNKVPAPAIISLEGGDFTLLSGKIRTPMPGLGGLKSVKHTWLIQSDKTTTLTIMLNSSRAGSDSKQVKIGG
ncbi:MAG: hypothetical protein LC649_10705 [Bacteroidales bacterium]|nr:hypothetical protein [Bacteroidales bacterium]